MLREDRVTFHPDIGLMFLIQKTTNQSSDEILGFFYDFGKEAGRRVIESISKKSQSSYKRSIDDLYPGTVIPFSLRVEGHKHWHYGDKEEDGSKFTCNIHVSFPENPNFIDAKSMMDMIVEKQLLGGSSIPPFDAPPPRASKGFKGLVEEVLRKRDENKTNVTGSNDVDSVHGQQSEEQLTTNS